jgi:hypothetical protein
MPHTACTTCTSVSVWFSTMTTACVESTLAILLCFGSCLTCCLLVDLV